MWQCLKSRDVGNKQASRPNAGVGLIEIALFVMASGLVLASAAPLYHVYTNHKRLEVTNTSLAQAQQALNTYLRIHGNLPCPSPRNLAPDTVNYVHPTTVKFGTAVDCTSPPGGGPGADGTAETPGALPSTKVRIGSVPTRSLGLPDEIMVDGFGHRLVYAVTEDYTQAVAPAGLGAGTITLQDSATSPHEATNGKVVYLLVAPGEDNRGAYNMAGNLLEACGTGNNCDETATFHEGAKRLSNPKFTSAIAFLAGTTAVNGVCGSASSATPVALAPTTNLCNPGTASSVPSGLGPWSWTCLGQNGGTTSPTCSATPLFTPVNGTCGSASSATPVASVPTINLCSAGTASAVGGTGTPNWNWTCAGLNGGAPSPLCAAVQIPVAVNGTCGIASSATPVAIPPTINLCSAGAASSVPSGPGPWSWTCLGSGFGATNSPVCSAVQVPLAVNGTCGSASSATPVATIPTINLCTAGTASTINGTGTPNWNWTCAGINGGTPSPVCSAVQTPPVPIAGSCGPANSTPTTSMPSGPTLCSTGTATAVTGTGPWFWTCSGLNGGGPSPSCQASYLNACTTTPFDGDLEILVDGSGSIAGDFNAEKTFLKNFVATLNLKPTSHIALIEFGSQRNSSLNFNISGLLNNNNNSGAGQKEVRRDLSDYNWIKPILTNPGDPNYAQLMTNAVFSTYPSPVKDAILSKSVTYTSATLPNFNTMVNGLLNAGSMTDLYGGLLAATDQVRTMSANPNKVILLITDGAETVFAYNSMTDTTADRLHYAAVARAAEALGIRVIAVGVQDSSYNPWELHDATINQKGLNFFEATGATTLAAVQSALTDTLCAIPGSTAGKYKKISAGGSPSGGTTCAITYDGDAKCWGDNGRGALGNGDNTYTTTSIPQNVVRNTSGPVPMAASAFWTDISVGGGENGGFACGLMSDGSAWCWGNNTYNQLGCHESLTPNHPKYCTTPGNGPDVFNVPQRVSTPLLPGNDTSWTSISAGNGQYGHACGRTIDGHGWCWGVNLAGQLGDGTTTSRAFPVMVTSIDSNTSSPFDNDLHPWDDIQAGGGPNMGATCGVMDYGQGLCWGNKIGAAGIIKSPALVTGVLFQTISTGTGITACGLGRSGTPQAGLIYCWGDNGAGELGLGSTYTAIPSPQLVPLPPGETAWTAISNGNAGFATVCGLTSDGKAWCWGLNNYGQFGNSQYTTPVLYTPQPAGEGNPSAPLGLSWKDISVGGGGDGFVCGLASDNTAWCWGSNGAGQIGNGLPIVPNTSVLSPYQIP